MSADEKYNHGFSVERHKNERYELMREFYRQAAEITDLLKKLNGKDHIVFTFDEVDKLDLNIMQNVNNKISIKKTYSTEKKLVFEVLMMKGGEFGLHSHKDCSEITYVESGSMFERVSDIDYKTGGTAIFLSGQEHEIIALENTFLIVTFLKDE